MTASDLIRKDLLLFKTRVNLAGLFSVVEKEAGPEDDVDYDENSKPDKGACNCVWEPAAKITCNIHHY